MNKPLFVILTTITLDAVGIGLVVPVIPDLLRELGGGSAIPQRVGQFMAIYALMQFIFSPVLGGLSDRIGRRPVLLVSLAGAAVDYLVMAMTPSLLILFLGRVVSGITGANMSVGTAYIADISSEEDRAKRFGQMHACFGLGFIAGPLLGGLVGGFSPRYPFALAAILNGITFLLAYFVMPESHSKEARRFTPGVMNPIAPLLAIMKLKNIIPLLTIYFMMELAGQVPAGMWVVYHQDTFKWDAMMVGISLASFGVFHALAQAFLTGPVTKRLGERVSLLMGIAFDVVAFLLLAFATRSWMVFPIMVLLCLGGIAMPALQALLSKKVDESKQGELQGIMVSLLSLTSIIGPLVATNAYAALLPYFPGGIWIGAAVLYLLCLPAFLRWPAETEPVVESVMESESRDHSLVDR